MGKIRDVKEIQARIAELERTYDLRGGCNGGPENQKLLIERAVLVWVLGGSNTIAYKGVW